MSDDYYNEAKEWQMNTNEIKTLERNRYFVLLLLVGLIAAACAYAVVSLAPLKEKVPYLVENNTISGEIKVLKKMEEGQFKSSVANDKKYVGEYLIYRESFDHHDIKEHYRNVQLMSTEEVSAEYVDYIKNDPDSPYQTFGDKDHIEIEIGPMNPLKSDKISTSFITTIETIEYRQGKKPVRKKWSVVVDFTWKGIPNDSKYEIINPAGFTVTRYRKDQIIN